MPILAVTRVTHDLSHLCVLVPAPSQATNATRVTCVFGSDWFVNESTNQPGRWTTVTNKQLVSVVVR